MPRTITATVGSEASGSTNRPVELFDLYLDSGTIHLVNFSENIDFYDSSGDAATYTAFPITRDEKGSSSGLTIDSTQINAANVDLGMSAYLADNEFRGRRIVIRKIFFPYVTATGDAVTIMDGVVTNVRADQNVLSAEVANRYLWSLKNRGPRRWFAPQCNWKFADPDTCGLSGGFTALYDAKSGTVDASSTSSLIRDAARTEANGYWQHGEVKFTSGTYNGQKRLILNSSGDGTGKYFTLDYNLAGAPTAGDAYTIKRGCDKSLLRCSGDFSNEIAFGGFNTIPLGNDIIR